MGKSEVTLTLDMSNTCAKKLEIASVCGIFEHVFCSTHCKELKYALEKVKCQNFVFFVNPMVQPTYEKKTDFHYVQVVSLFKFYNIWPILQHTTKNSDNSQNYLKLFVLILHIKNKE